MRDNKALIEALAENAKAIDTNKRKIESSVELGPADNGDTIHLCMSVHHYSEAKRFLASVHLEQRESKVGWAISKWEPMNDRHNLRLPGQQIPRYSAKLLQEQWRSAINHLHTNPELLDRLDLEVKSIGG